MHAVLTFRSRSRRLMNELHGETIVTGVCENNGSLVVFITAPSTQEIGALIEKIMRRKGVSNVTLNTD